MMTPLCHVFGKYLGISVSQLDGNVTLQLVLETNGLIGERKEKKAKNLRVSYGCFVFDSDPSATWRRETDGDEELYLDTGNSLDDGGFTVSDVANGTYERW